MAKILPHGEGYTGKMGGTVAYQTKNGVIARTYREDVANPQTTNQTRQRVRFLTANGLAAGLRDQIAGFAPYANRLRITKRNAFVKSVLAATYEDTGGNTVRVIEANPVFGSVVATVAYEQIPLSRGSVAMFRGSAPTAVDTDISVSFGYLTVGEVMHVVAYNPALNQAVGTVVEVTAATQTVTLAWPPTWTGGTVYVYAYSQAFNNASERITYLSYFNGGDVAAEADIRAIESLGTFSETSYLGQVTVG